LAEKASFQILNCTPFTDIFFFPIWWLVYNHILSIKAAGKLACVFIRMHKHTNQ
jgi:hypothetical protein